MTHSYEDIIRLDSERTQGVIRVKETSDKRLSLLVINNGSFPDKVSTQLFINDANYFAAMPDAVGLLKEYRRLLESVLAEALEHWPDAEEWVVIKELQAILEK